MNSLIIKKTKSIRILNRPTKQKQETTKIKQRNG